MKQVKEVSKLTLKSLDQKINRSVAMLSDKIDRLAGVVEALTIEMRAGFAQVNARLDAVEKRLDNLEKDVAELKHDVALIKQCPTIKKELAALS